MSPPGHALEPVSPGGFGRRLSSGSEGDPLSPYSVKTPHSSKSRWGEDSSAGQAMQSRKTHRRTMLAEQAAEQLAAAAAEQTAAETRRALDRPVKQSPWTNARARPGRASQAEGEENNADEMDSDDDLTLKPRYDRAKIGGAAQWMVEHLRLECELQAGESSKERDERLAKAKKGIKEDETDYIKRMKGRAADHQGHMKERFVKLGQEAHGDLYHATAVEDAIHNPAELVKNSLAHYHKSCAEDGKLYPWDKTEKQRNLSNDHLKRMLRHVEHLTVADPERYWPDKSYFDQARADDAADYDEAYESPTSSLHDISHYRSVASMQSTGSLVKPDSMASMASMTSMTSEGANRSKATRFGGSVLPQRPPVVDAEEHDGTASSTMRATMLRTMASRKSDVTPPPSPTWSRRNSGQQSATRGDKFVNSLDSLPSPPKSPTYRR